MTQLSPISREQKLSWILQFEKCRGISFRELFKIMSGTCQWLKCQIFVKNLHGFIFSNVFWSKFSRGLIFAKSQKIREIAKFTVIHTKINPPKVLVILQAM